jgi:hypothetical protein
MVMSKDKKFFWKVWLRVNYLTKDVKTDYVAEIDANGRTLYNEDIAKLIKEEGSELTLETLIDIINRADKVRIQAILDGRRVRTLLVHISPRVSGVWGSATAHYDPEKHRLICDVTLTADMHAALEEVGIIVLGVKESSAIIGMVTDSATGLTDGSITPGDDIVIEGNKIKITPNNVDTIGVFFIDSEGTAHKVTRRFTQNTPKCVIARVPAGLTAGEYTLKIVTKFSGAADLRDPRAIVYSLPLTVAEQK